METPELVSNTLISCPDKEHEIGIVVPTIGADIEQVGPV
jgi:hypothetical protein